MATMICQIWAAEMTGRNDYIPFVMSRLMCGLFGALPAILGSGYIMNMFFLHQRGKAFVVFELTVIFAVVGSGTFGGFIAQSRPWPYVFWWTVGPLAAAIILVFCFVEDTGFSPGLNTHGRAPLPKGWVANRIATFLPGTRTVPRIRFGELVSWFELHICKLASDDALINCVLDRAAFHALHHSFHADHASHRNLYLHCPGYPHHSGYHSIHISPKSSGKGWIWLHTVAKCIL